MPAAVAIPFLVSTGISVAQGIKASKAAKKAAKQETQASTTALEQVAQPVYQEQRQLWNPYVQVGRGALGNLSALTGLPGLPPQEPRPNYGPPQGMPLGQMGQPPQGGSAVGGAGRAVSTLGAGSLIPGGGQGLSSADVMQVRLRAPNGEIQSVPVSQMDHYIQRGATRVS